MVSTFLLQGPNRGLISFGTLRPLRKCCTVFSGKPETRSILTDIIGWLKYHVVVFLKQISWTPTARSKNTHTYLMWTVIMKIHLFFDAHRLSSTSSCGKVLPHYYWNILHFTISSQTFFCEVSWEFPKHLSQTHCSKTLNGEKLWNTSRMSPIVLFH